MVIIKTEQISASKPQSSLGYEENVVELEFPAGPFTSSSLHHGYKLSSSSSRLPGVQPRVRPSGAENGLPAVDLEGPACGYPGAAVGASSWGKHWLSPGDSVAILGTWGRLWDSAFC